MVSDFGAHNEGCRDNLFKSPANLLRCGKSAMAVKGWVGVG
jgi:hypothetical protein